MESISKLISLLISTIIYFCVNTSKGGISNICIYCLSKISLMARHILSRQLYERKVPVCTCTTKIPVREFWFSQCVENNVCWVFFFAPSSESFRIYIVRYFSVTLMTASQRCFRHNIGESQESGGQNWLTYTILLFPSVRTDFLYTNSNANNLAQYTRQMLRLLFVT